MSIILKPKSKARWIRPAVLVTCLFTATTLIPSLLKAGTGGVQGGCAFPKPVNGQIKWEPCTGLNLPMWYSSANPDYNPDELPCGQYGNQNCGVTTGDPMSE